jgi:hypothetical protein
MNSKKQLCNIDHMRAIMLAVFIVSFCGVAAGDLSAPEFSNRTVELNVSDSDFSDYVVLNAESPQDSKQQVSERATGTVHLTQSSVADSSEDNRISSDDIEVYSTDDTDTITFESILENGSVKVSGDFDDNDSINYTAAETVNLSEQNSGEFSGAVKIAEADASGGLRASSGEQVSFSYFDGSNRVRSSTVLDTTSPEFTSARQESARQLSMEFSESVSGPSGERESSSVAFPNLDSAVPSDVSVSEESDSFTVSIDLNASISTGRQPLADYTSNLTDAAGNTATGAALKPSDSAAPQPRVIYSRDQNADGRLDTIEAVMSEQLADTFIVSDVFSVSQGEDSLGVSAASSEGNQITIALEEDIVWTGPVTLGYNPSGISPLQDDKGNEVDEFQTGSVDRAPLTLVGSYINSSKSNSSTTVIELVFSEEVRRVSGSEPRAKVDGQNTKIDLSNGAARVTLGKAIDVTSKPLVSSVAGVTDGRGNGARLGFELPVSAFPNSSRVGNRAEPVSLREGWNLVSLPVDTDSKVPIDAVFSNQSNIESIWRYVNGEWDVWVPRTQLAEYTHMRGGLGYAVKTKQRMTFRPKLFSAEDTSDDLDVGQQWVLAGGTEPYEQEATGDSAFSHLDGVGDVKQLDGGGISQSESLAGNATPGEGYWVEVNGGTLAGSFSSSTSLGEILGGIWK